MYFSDPLKDINQYSDQIFYLQQSLQNSLFTSFVEKF